MKSKYSFSIIAVLLLAVTLSACGGQTATVAPSDEETDLASLVDALRADGASVEPAGEISQDFFTTQGQIIQVNDQDVQVFEYISPAEADAEATQVSVDGSSVGTTMITWISAPNFYKSGSLIVLYIGDEAGVIELLEAQLGSQFAGR